MTTIPAEAIEAAAMGILGVTPDVWDLQMPQTKERCRADAQAALEAAAPLLMAQGFDEGQKSGIRHADRLVAAAKIGRPELPGPISPNPYRG